LTHFSLCHVLPRSKPWDAAFKKFPQLETAIYFAFWCAACASVAASAGENGRSDRCMSFELTHPHLMTATCARRARGRAPQVLAER
jgi:hypothetical protein